MYKGHVTSSERHFSFRVWKCGFCVFLCRRSINGARQNPKGFLFFSLIFLGPTAYLFFIYTSTFSLCLLSFLILYIDFWFWCLAPVNENGCGYWRHDFIWFLGKSYKEDSKRTSQGTRWIICTFFIFLLLSFHFPSKTERKQERFCLFLQICGFYLSCRASKFLEDKTD